MSEESLLAAALAVREKAHAPYSHFSVGAALQSRDGRVFTGCNVENLSFGLTSCAERNAIFAAVADGAREFLEIVIVSDSQEPVSPCGACRQVLAEFADDLPIRCVNLEGREFRSTLQALLPRAKTGILG